jgi:hypothetical protein
VREQKMKYFLVRQLLHPFVGIAKSIDMPRSSLLRLTGLVKTDRLKVLGGVNPAFFAINANFDPDVVTGADAEGVLPFFQSDENLGRENLDVGFFSDYDVRGEPSLFVGFVEHANKGEILITVNALDTFHRHLTTAFHESVAGLVHTMLGQIEFAFPPVDVNWNGNEKISSEEPNAEFISENLGEVADFGDFARNEIAHFSRGIEWFADGREFAVDDTEDLPRAATQWCGGQAAGLYEEAGSVAASELIYRNGAAF